MLQVGAGILAVGFGSAFFLTANLGPGPRDGWMTGIHRRTGFGIASVRTTLELSAVAYALLLGYALAAIFRLMTLITPNAQTVPDTA